MSDTSTTFNQFSKLPPPLVTTAVQVMNFAGHYVDLKEPKSFQWDKFLDGDDFTFDKFQSNTINQQTSTVSTMVDKIVDFLRVTLSVVLTSQDIDALKKNVETTFTGLKEAKDNGWADFSKSSSSSNTSWQYRVLFAFPNPDLEDWFYSLVTTIKLEADIHDEESWWGLQSSSSHNFSAAIDGMELVVMKGFRDPIKA
uniref:Delta-endotoxin CytB n=1 Tax=Moniliophthora roreri TaxID=221103 RepID=A0A0W0EWG5_MONRR